jgi:integrase
LEAYEQYLREKGNKESSIDQTMRKMRRFFGDLEVPLSALTRKRVERYYDELKKTKKKDGTLLSVDYHRNTLAEARTFLKWCATKKKWIESNPLDGVEGIGRRKHGKAQLRIDEARLWIAKAVELADAGESGAVAALMTLLMGLRASEIINRVARDLDDGGSLLWIPDAKTAKGRRTVQVPEELRPYLLQLVEEKEPNELLFGHHWRDWPREWVQRICKLADVPVVTAHGMRGLHSTLAVDAGVTSHAVASALGHESFATTAQSYAKPEALTRAKQRRVLKVLAGGKQ